MRISGHHLGIVALVCGLAACSESKDEADDTVRIAWIAKNDSEFFDIGREGARQAAADLSSASGRTVEALILDPETLTVEAQTEQIQAALDQGADAIDLDAVDAAGMVAGIDAATAAGATVLTFDSDSPDSSRVSYFSLNNLEAGAACADAAVTLRGEVDPTQVAIMTSGFGGQPSTARNHVDRLDGFNNALASHATFEVIATTLCSPEVEEAPGGCAAVLEQTTIDHPEIDLWYIARGSIFRQTDLATAAPTWSAAVLGGTVKVVGFDAPGPALPQIQAGYAQFVVSQKYFGWGYDVATLSFDVVTTGRVLDPFYDSGFDIVCQNNVDQLASMWQAQDFRTPLDACDLTQ
jgi:ribose transport system substrate-binding protein